MVSTFYCSSKTLNNGFPQSNVRKEYLLLGACGFYYHLLYCNIVSFFINHISRILFGIVNNSICLLNMIMVISAYCVYIPLLHVAFQIHFPLRCI